MSKNLTKQVVTQRLVPDSGAATTWTLAGGQTEKNTNSVNRSGFNAVRFIVGWGAIAGTAVTSAKVQESNDDGNTDPYADVAGSHVTVADTDDNKLTIIDVFNPLKKWVRLDFLRATANAAIDFVIVELYHASVESVTQDATVQGINVLSSPGLGTA